MQIGLKIATEAFGPKEVVRQAQVAERAGFDFVELSDHYHPWLESQGHSAFTWSMLGSIATSTETIGLVTGVTCPSFRYHPAIIAQAAATVALLSDNRFTLGVGSGERLSEHIVGREFPGVHKRQRVFREALEIIKLLWQGGYQNYDGRYLQLEDARIFDLPDQPVLMPVASGGGQASRIAAELGDGLFATEPKSSLVNSYSQAGGDGPRYAEVPLAWAPDEDAAAQAVLETTRWALTGWKVMSELPNPVNFEAASATVRLEDVQGQFACGPDAQKHLAAAQQFVDAGFDHLVLMNAGPDPDGFIEFFSNELAEPLRTMTPSS
ncbi:MAG TPA: TIGR03557 family F420-dependent LLM class oxidoreductase [Frankiaceae bacterium]|nr:TIGR03557 family F420-dependent LLM class oxidoreductase [Frankiaceae bacterium]